MIIFWKRNGKNGYPKNLNHGELHFYFMPTSKVKIILFYQKHCVVFVNLAIK